MYFSEPYITKSNTGGLGNHYSTHYDINNENPFLDSENTQFPKEHQQRSHFKLYFHVAPVSPVLSLQ